MGGHAIATAATATAGAATTIITTISITTTNTPFSPFTGDLSRLR